MNTIIPLSSTLVFASSAGRRCFERPREGESAATPAATPNGLAEKFTGVRVLAQPFIEGAAAGGAELRPAA
jgi:hypothetical protein